MTDTTQTARVLTRLKERYQSVLPASSCPRGGMLGNLDQTPSVVRHRILLAEDNAVLASYTTHLLRDVGEVRHAADGEEALTLAFSWLPHIVISDIMMPRRDGLSLCRELKADPRTRSIPVVLLTALTHRESLIEGWEAGADDYLFKPFHPEVLQTRVRIFLSAIDAEAGRFEAESALEKEGEFLSALLENLSDGIVACDERGTLTLFNRVIREFHGLSEQSLPPEQWSELHDMYLADGNTPMPLDQVPLFRAFQGELVRNVEIVIAPRNCVRRTVICNGQPLISAAGGKLGAVVTMHDITERKEAERLLQQLAHFDPLTALPNRTLFYESLHDALARAAEENWIVSVLFLDIDHFKNVNDSIGHAGGDELLRQVGRRLVRSLRVRDTVGRLGGDEFAIILMRPDNPQSGAIVAHKLRDALRQPFSLEGREVTVTASIGITVFPTDSTDAEVLINCADTAMYAAKQAGRGTYRFYTAAMNANAVRRVELDNALRKALEHDEFVLHYQPKINLTSGHWTGVEALLRWNRPGHGLVMPGDFILSLEETGLIEPVGIWIIDAACRQIAEWIAAGIGPVPVAVNVSVKQLLRGHLDQDATRDSREVGDLIESAALESAVEHALREHGIAPNLLEFELTESTLMLHAAKTVGLLQRLKSLGIHLSIDDFGTGYSSLAYLKRFSVDTIKIDQAFICDITTDVDAAAIAVAIISLAHSLKLKVVAEGVETHEQLDCLRAQDCDEAQGYYMAQPMTAEEIVTLFRATSMHIPTDQDSVAQ